MKSFQPGDTYQVASDEAKHAVAAGIEQGWIKAPLSKIDVTFTDEEARDQYLEIWWRIREIELQRLKLDNEQLREQLLLLSFERAHLTNSLTH